MRSSQPPVRTEHNIDLIRRLNEIDDALRRTAWRTPYALNQIADELQAIKRELATRQATRK
jgi:hypothetical protein